MKKWALFCCFPWYLSSCLTAGGTDGNAQQVHFTVTPPEIDGYASDNCWDKAPLYPIDQLWSGKLPHASDFMGRYRLCWDSSHLYLLAEVYDDSLVDHSPVADRYWDRDGLDIFLVNVPGMPTGYPSVLTYHITFDSLYLTVPAHAGSFSTIKFAASQKGHLIIWEAAIDMPPIPQSAEGSSQLQKIDAGSMPGFSIAYNDNDKGKERESRMGNMPVGPGPVKTPGGSDPGVYKPLRLETRN